jgi:hypothetical protein
MKNIKIKNWLGVFLMLLAISSCSDFLDVNENPNSATSVTVDLLLPQAIVATANLSNAYNNYGAHFGGFQANAGGFSGFGILLTYDVAPSTYDGLWTAAYQNSLQDFKLVIDGSEGDDNLAYFNAAAKILTALNYQRLVDAFGDVAYSKALNGNDNLAPDYDGGATIYQELVGDLDEAMAIIDNAAFPTPLNSSTDPLFGGDMDSWKRLANTIKLRLLIRISNVGSLNAFVTAGFASFGATPEFLEEDAIVNPGFVKNFPCPVWNSWGYSTTTQVAGGAQSRIPTNFVFGFYNASKINDPGRGSVIFKNFPATPVNQLGNEIGNPTIVTGYSTWYTGVATSSSTTDALGILKGPSQGQVLMLAAEAHFLQAEAYLENHLVGSFTASFNAGVRASFNYLYKDVNGEVDAANNINDLVDEYLLLNVGNPLVDITLAGTDAARLEAIITQKYIALNMVNCDEAWNEFRRTGYPVTVPLGEPFEDIASTKSNSTRPDRMISRIMYPSSEAAYNEANFKVINQFSDLIFWDPN